MKILQIITLTELGGAQTVVASLANELCKDNEVIVVGGEGNGQMWTLFNSEIKTDSVNGLVRRISPINEFKALWNMRRIYRKYHPDVVHLHSSKAGLIGRIAFPSSKVVYTVHGFDSIRVAFRKFLPLERYFQRFASAIIGVSRYDYNHMLADGISRNVDFVYNGVSEPERLEHDPFEELRSEFQVGVILCIARLSPQKNLQLFLETAKQMPQTAFVWIGNLREPDFDVPENCRFMGNIPNAGRYCHYADIFFLPSNYEGLPMVILESLACGTPVVASNVGGIPEILDGNNGITIENTSEQAEAAISAILADRKTFSDSALKTYQERFTVKQMTDGYRAIYSKIRKL